MLKPLGDFNVYKEYGRIYVDLEDYDFTPGSHAFIRATEGTIQSRIPPRLKIREGASIELPHVMVLIDDPQKQLIEKLYQQKDSLV